MLAKWTLLMLAIMFFTKYMQGPMLDTQYSFLPCFVPIFRNGEGDVKRLGYLPGVTQSYSHSDLSESKSSGFLIIASAKVPRPFPYQTTNNKWALGWTSPPELQGLQPNFTNIQLHRLHEATYKYEDNRVLSMNNSQLLFLSLKNALIIVFTAVNHKNESPQIFERNSPSKYVNFVPWIHLFWDHMMPPSTALYLNVTFFHSVLIPQLKIASINLSLEPNITVLLTETLNTDLGS